MQAVILAGGLGTRLRPLTLTIPKPMVEIAGKPYLYYQLMYLKKYKITDILLCIGHLGHQIKEYFGTGRKYGLNIRYSSENKPLGTGGGLKKARRLLQNSFILLYGDSFLPVNYSGLQAKFRAYGKSGLIAVYDNKDNTKVKNNIALDAGRAITRYDKISPGRDLQYVESGVLVLKKKILGLFPKREKVSLEIDIFPRLIKQRQLKGYICKNRFYDIGTFTGIRNFRRFLAQNQALYKNLIYNGEKT
ncbi:MAG: nucleotidyltransferase family protein [Planctomycetes bacterium]|nr:nucleotidyltransferase family protein [Planctomycetota bacterium]